MAKNKDQKKKDRERRVAKKKLADTAKKRAEERAAEESATSSQPRKVIQPPAPRVTSTDETDTDSRSPFTTRRLGG